MDEIQKKQDKLNAMKNRKAYPNGANTNSREMRGESPTRNSLSTVKPSRSSSVNRPIKRLTAVSTSPSRLFVVSSPWNLSLSPSRLIIVSFTRDNSKKKHF